MNEDLIQLKLDLIIIKLTIAMIIALLVISAIAIFVLIDPFCCGDLAIP